MLINGLHQELRSDIIYSEEVVSVFERQGLYISISVKI